MDWDRSDIPPQDGRTAVVTGVGGLGYEVGLALAAAGADVVLAGRSPDKGEAAVSAIRTAVTSAKVRFEPLDLASLASVQAFAERMLAAGKALDILVNNAGVMNPPQRKPTADGFELQFGTNYLGHFALTMRLLPLLLRAPSPRVVSVASVVHRRGRIAFDDLQATSSYRPHLAYAQSKLAMILFARELERRARTAGSRLVSIAAHPGIARTKLFENSGQGGLPNFIVKLITPLIAHSAAAGALPILYAATSPDAVGGGYYGPVGSNEMKGPPGMATVAPQGLDEAAARRLFEVSEDLTGLSLRLEPGA